DTRVLQELSMNGRMQGSSAHSTDRRPGRYCLSAKPTSKRFYRGRYGGHGGLRRQATPATPTLLHLNLLPRIRQQTSARSTIVDRAFCFALTLSRSRRYQFEVHPYVVTRRTSRAINC